MLRYLQGIENIKDFTAHYLQYIFLAEEKGQIKFYDGHKLLKFSKMPTIVKKNQWDFRMLPALLIGTSDAELQCIGFEKDFLGDTVSYTVGTETVGPSGRDFYEAGGDISLNMSVDIYAYTQEERDKLTDIVSVYLSGPTAKDYFMKKYVRLPTALRVTEGGTVFLPPVELPVYYNTIRFQAVGAWRDREYYGERLADIIFALEFVTDINAVAPHLNSAAVQDSSTVRLSFNSALTNNDALLEPTNYTFTGPTLLTASSIVRINSATVDVYVSGTMNQTSTYEVTVENVTNTAGVTIDPDYNSAAFVVPYLGPILYTALLVTVP
jgi:hypothetical protein